MNFYKYTTISTAELILEHKSLRWSSPLVFNDIEECQFTPFTEEQNIQAFDMYKKILDQCANGCLLFNVNDFSENTNFLIRLISICKSQGKDFTCMPEELLDGFSDMFRDYINKGLVNSFRVLCVTTEYDNNLMWAHYGDQHSGCVIEFDEVFSEKPHLLREGKIRYHENIKPLSNPLDMLLYGETPKIKELMIKDIIFSKRTSWQYENEYRFMFVENYGQTTFKLDMQTNKYEITSDSEKVDLYSDVPISRDSIKSITFGVRTKLEEINKFVSMAGKYQFNCNFYQMKMKSGSLIKEQLNSNCGKVAL